MKSDKTSGFTLIELTIVLFIVGLLLAGLLLPLREGIQSERRVETLERLKSIEESLYGFAIANGRLPCPDCRNAGVGNCNAAGVILNDGIEDVNGLYCAADPNPGADPAAPPGTVISAATPNVDVIEGNVPWVTLGTDQFDNWESWYTYSVSDYAADNQGDSVGNNCVYSDAENLASIQLCTDGLLTIQDVGAACPSPPAVLPPNNVAQNVIAVVISHGANVTRTANPGTGLIDAPLLCSEVENSDADGVFVTSTFINPGDPGATAATAPSVLGIDDMLIWISPHILKSKLVQAGRLP